MNDSVLILKMMKVDKSACKLVVIKLHSIEIFERKKNVRRGTGKSKDN